MAAPNREDGFTLVEVLIVSVLMLVVLGATLTALTSFERATAANQRQNTGQDQIRNAMDLMTRDLRNLASPTVNLPQAVDRADAADLIFQSEGRDLPAGSSNVTNTNRVRYCLSPAGDLYRQTQTWTTSAAPGVPVDTPCPGSGWPTTKIVAEDIVNGARPVFTYNSANRPEITEVSTTLFVDVNPGKPPVESTLQSSVYLRNQNRAPIAAFSVAASSGSQIIMNASESADPEEKALFFEWFLDGASIGGDIVRTQVVTPGNHTVFVRVSDGTLTDDAPQQSICVPAPAQGVNCP
jgi:prepilin-type N-terminal cleavage/methylation domain-containing protein